MPSKVTILIQSLLFCAAGMILASAAKADNFSHPQKVYSQKGVEHTKFSNGGIVNKAMIDQMKRVQPEEGYTVELAKGVWALVGHH